MRELGQSDATHRNYNLLHLRHKQNAVDVVNYAYIRMKLGMFAGPHVLANIRAKLRDVGYIVRDDHALAVLMREWYAWDRIRKGELMHWPLRPGQNPLL